MRGVILEVATRIFVPLLVLFSVVVLLRGHDGPGGGFIGGAIAGVALTLYAIVFTPVKARSLLRVDDRRLTGIGLSIALASGVIGPMVGDAPFTAYWTQVELIGIGPLWIGTPMLFDLGVYVTVVGAVLMIVFALTEKT